MYRGTGRDESEPTAIATAAGAVPEPARPDVLGANQRRLLSRELHDRVAQLIAASLHSLELHERYDRSGRTDRARAKLCAARGALRQALDTTTSLATGLRSPYGTGRPTVRRPWPRVDSDEVFVIVREAISNALAHAGAAHITVTLSTTDTKVCALVEDDGVGIGRDAPAGVGLESMWERVTILGGDLRISTGADGTRVAVAIPVARES